LPDIEELELDKLLMFEKDLLGFYLHEPPYLKRLKQLSQAIKVRISALEEIGVNGRVIFGGVILETKKVFTKKSGSEMAFVKISDGSGEIECVVFPKTYSLSKGILNKEEVVIINGKLDKREEEFSVLVDTVEVFDGDEYVVLETGEEQSKTAVEIEIPRNADTDLMKQVNLQWKKFPGENPITVLIPSNGSFKRLDLPFKIDPSAELLKTLEGLLGPNAIKVN
jgi:DNA polymerase-3 subunit alpha